MGKALRGLCRPASGLTLIALLAMSTSAFALGLGQIQSNTDIGQNFRAKIPILDYSGNGLANIKASLASASVYKQMGLALPDYLYSLKFSTSTGPNGPYVLVTSNKPVRLPFINLLIQVQWPSGEVTRQYTVLLNPPVYASNQKRTAPVQVPVSRSTPPTPTVQAQPVPQRQPATSSPTSPTPKAPQTPHQAAATPTQVPASRPVDHTYGPIPKGATLWGLAHRLRPSSKVSINQMMIALYRANPGAFFGNINRLKAGYILRIPTRDQLSSVTPVGATRDVARQDQQWNQFLVAEQQPQSSHPSSASPSSSPASSTPSPAAPSPTNKVQPKVSSSVSAQSKGGRVILSAPAVTAAVNKSSVGATLSAVTAHRKGSSPAQPVQQAAPAATASSGVSSKSSPQASTASSPGPVKIGSDALARLSSKKAAQPKSIPAAKARTAVRRTHLGRGLGSIFEDWATSPKGWVLAAGIILLLLAGALAVRKRSGRDGNGPERRISPDVQPPAGSGTEQTDEQEHEVGDYVQGQTIDQPEEVPAEAELAPATGESTTQIGATESPSEPDDPLAQADFHAGYGRREQAIEILRDALTQDSTRNDVRLKLLELLFDAGLGAEFAVEAREYYRQMEQGDEGRRGWDQIAVMGRQLLPSDSFFASEETPEEVFSWATSEAATEEERSDENPEDQFPAGGDLEFEMELDRLSGTPSTAEDEQREFDKTLEELSTFIETYVPGEQDRPLDIQLPQGLTEDGSTESTAQQQEDDVLEFELSEEDLQSLEFVETEEEDKELYADTVGTKLDLARAYIDMGDNDSAREILEEVVDEGNEDRQREARQLLESIG